MIMSKLGTSLRNSITAEKQSIANKDLPIKPIASENVKQKTVKVNPAKKLVTQKSSLVKPKITSNKKPKASIVKKTAAKESVEMKQVLAKPTALWSLMKPRDTLLKMRDNSSVNVQGRLHNEVFLTLFRANLDYLENLLLATAHLQDIFSNSIQSKFDHLKFKLYQMNDLLKL